MICVRLRIGNVYGGNEISPLKLHVENHKLLKLPQEHNEIMHCLVEKFPHFLTKKPSYQIENESHCLEK